MLQQLPVMDGALRLVRGAQFGHAQAPLLLQQLPVIDGALLLCLQLLAPLLEEFGAKRPRLVEEAPLAVDEAVAEEAAEQEGELLRGVA